MWIEKRFEEKNDHEHEILIIGIVVVNENDIMNEITKLDYIINRKDWVHYYSVNRKHLFGFWKCI